MISTPERIPNTNQIILSFQKIFKNAVLIIVDDVYIWEQSQIIFQLFEAINL